MYLMIDREQRASTDAAHRRMSSRASLVRLRGCPLLSLYVLKLLMD
jgi:hypothetical protein